MHGLLMSSWLLEQSFGHSCNPRHTLNTVRKIPPSTRKLFQLIRAEKPSRRGGQNLNVSLHRSCAGLFLSRGVAKIRLRKRANVYWEIGLGNAAELKLPSFTTAAIFVEV